MTWIIVLLVVALIGWMAFNAWRLSRAAKGVSNETFAELMRTGQVIDLRQPEDYYYRHISGARNIPANQLKQSLSALRKDKPILLYELKGRGTATTTTALFLKKQGFGPIYILEYGLEGWDGKVKEGR